jgi:hypothetical protein
VLRPRKGIVLGTKNTRLVVGCVVGLGVEHQWPKLLEDSEEA